MSFLSRFYNGWKQRQKEIESQRLYSNATRKGMLRRDAIESLIAQCLVIHGVVYDEATVQRLADTVLDREFGPAFQLDTTLPLEELERQRWEIDCKILNEVVEEYMASDAEEVQAAKAMREASIQEAVKQRRQELNKHDDT